MKIQDKTLNFYEDHKLLMAYQYYTIKYFTEIKTNRFKNFIKKDLCFDLNDVRN